MWTLGFVSMLMDMSSELVHGLLPVFLVSTVSASVISVGLIEGIAEATAAVTKIFSGALSDRLGKRKLLVIAGYGLAAITKPVFPLATSAGQVLAARFVDRVGKGIRGAPRDALIADVTPAQQRGAAFGLRQALDTVGAFAGPLLAVALMTLYANDFRKVFWWATVPALCAVLLIAVGVREPEGVKRSRKRGWPIRRAELARLPASYWSVVGLGVALTLARFSEAFLVLKAQTAGLELALIPIVMVWMNLVYALVATPAGTLSDRIGRTKVILLGLIALIAADLALAFAPGLWGLFVGVGLWGLHMGLVQGLLSALVADTAPADLMGTGFGLFHLVTGVVLLVASVLAGWLWQMHGPTATFVAGAVFSIVAALVTATAPIRPARA